MKRHLLLGILAGFAALSGCSSNDAEVNRGEGDGGSGSGSGGGGTSSSSGGMTGEDTGGTTFGGRFGGDQDGGGTVKPPGTGNECAAEKAEVKPVGLDLALLVDTSYSMDFALRWQYVKGALLSFVSQPAQDDLGLALQFFPLRAQCDVPAYGTPAMAMASIASSRDDVALTVNGRRMSGGTPIVQALQGVGDYAAKWAKAHDDRKTVIVLATDGVPDDTCSTSDPKNDLANAGKTAEALLNGTPSIPVFVIGVGDELESLDSIAVKGGTDHAVLIKDGESAQKEFLAALENIRQKSLSCEYLVPTDNDDINLNTVNVEYTEGRKPATTFFYVEELDSCEKTPDEGWYYDDADKPTKVILCPQTCDRVAKAQDARIDISYGCKRQIPR